MDELRQPDPGEGVFETLLIHAGRPVELDAHLERLSSSLGSLYEQPIPPGTAAQVTDAARRVSLGRLRLTVAPDGSGALEAKVVTAAVEPEAVFPAWERGAELRSVAVHDGIGLHKWVDRKAVLNAEAEHPGAVPLLVDRDGNALEAGRANVFAVRDGALETPPADGRILPGIARARTIELARSTGIEVREGLLPREELRNADEVFLTGSVRGIEPAVSLDNEPLQGPGRFTEQLAGSLRRLWLSEPS